MAATNAGTSPAQCVAHESQAGDHRPRLFQFWSIWEATKHGKVAKRLRRHCRGESEHEFNCLAPLTSLRGV